MRMRDGSPEACESRDTNTACVFFDRLFDPYTPLVVQLRYISAAHELVGLEDNVLKMSNVVDSGVQDKVLYY